MPRPIRCRRICFAPEVTLFKPAGVPARYLDEVTLSVDELEALRLVDLDGRYQDGAAESMGVSRPTLSRILAEGRRKVAEALINGRALRVEGGEVRFDIRRNREPNDEDCSRRGSRSRRCCRRARSSGREAAATSSEIGDVEETTPTEKTRKGPGEDEVTNHNEQAVEEQ